MENGHITLDECTDDHKENCERQAGESRIINPIRSARLNTKHSFSFKYGHVEVVAKTPAGDWLWPGRYEYFLIFFEKYSTFVLLSSFFYSYLAFANTFKIWWMATLRRNRFTGDSWEPQIH